MFEPETLFEVMLDSGHIIYADKDVENSII